MRPSLLKPLIHDVFGRAGSMNLLEQYRYLLRAGGGGVVANKLVKLFPLPTTTIRGSHFMALGATTALTVIQPQMILWGSNLVHS